MGHPVGAFHMIFDITSHWWDGGKVPQKATVGREVACIPRYESFFQVQGEDRGVVERRRGQTLAFSQPPPEAVGAGRRDGGPLGLAPLQPAALGNTRARRLHSGPDLVPSVRVSTD